MVKNIRDLMAICGGLVVMPALWILNGLGAIQLPGEVVGATIAIETLIFQFYFRKKEPTR
jgi:hypothetical protein